MTTPKSEPRSPPQERGSYYVVANAVLSICLQAADMAGSYSIQVEPWGFLRFTLEGFFDAETFAGFVRERRAAFAKLTCAPNAHLTLVDLTNCALQSQTITAAFQTVMADATTRSRRMAFVFGDSPTRMQIRRILAARDDVGLFADEATAMAWLKAPDVRAA